MRQRIGFTLIVLLALLIAGCQGLSSEPRIVATSAPAPVSAEQDIGATMQLGGEVWANNCADCHGRMGEGTAQGAPLPNLTDKSDAEILAVITNGTSLNGIEMPAFGTRLAQDELNAAMTYSKMMSLAIQRGMVNSDATAVPNAEVVAPNATAEAAALEPNATVEVASLPIELPGVVTGTLTNGTVGTPLLSDQTVTLHVVTSDITEQSFDVTVNADGTYRFENIPFSPDYQYVVTAPYGDVQYVSEIAAADLTTLALDLPVSIYEGGATTDDVAITGMSLQLGVSGGLLQIIQIASYTNNSDRVFFSVNDGVGTSVGLQIPPDATMLDNVSNRYTVIDNTIYDSRPMLPGEAHLIHASYTLPYTDSAMVVQPITFPMTGSLSIVVASDGLTISGEGITPQEPVTSGGRQYASFGGDLSLVTGSTLSFTVSGTPAAASAQSTGTEGSSVTPFAYILIGAGISALLISGVLILRDRMRPAPAPAGVAVSKAATDNKADIADLMEQIAALDARHKAGEINTPEYKRQRAALKSQLAALMNGQ